MSRDLVQRRRRLEAVRSRFDGRHLGSADLDPEVGESWRRCSTLLSVDHTAPVAFDDPESRWDASPIRRAAPDVIDELSELALSEDYIAAVTDAAGRIVWSAAGRSMARLAERAHFVRGASWREEVAGTNAPGLALLTGRPAAVFASEHWCHGVQDWVCYAAPVRSPSGEVVGVLDLSVVWRRASPLALTTVVALSRLVEQLLAAAPRPEPDLRLAVLGTPRAEVFGQPVRISQRQLEILTILATRREVRFEELHDLLYGERPISGATLKAEMSHLRHLLGGAIDSRPYRLTLVVEADVVDALGAVRRGDAEAALRLYRGPLLPASESPGIVDLRHHVDVGLRTLVLGQGTPDQLGRFAEVHPFDTEVLERACALTGPFDPAYGDLAARLERAQA